MAAVPGNRTKIAVLCLALFCGALFLSALSAKKPALSQGGLVLVDGTLRPFKLILGGTAGSVSRFWENYIALYNIKTEYEELQKGTASSSTCRSMRSKIGCDNFLK